MYSQGHGVAKDEQEAARFYKKAAEQGFGDAQFALGEMYSLGRGVLKNRVIAYALNSLAIAQDVSPVEKHLNQEKSLQRTMSPDELKTAQALAHEMSKPGNFLKALDAYASSIGHR
jgi:hypothetical protein